MSVEVIEQNPYPEMTSAELQAAWIDYSGAERVLSLPHVLGVVAVPHWVNEVNNILSVDVDEIIRATHHGMAATIGLRPDQIPDYTTISGTLGIGHGEESGPVIDAMNQGLIGPVDGIEDIADMLVEFRARKAIVIANTSTLSGCEAVTIDMFKNYLPDCFDGIVFPRNHWGDAGSMNKALALEIALSELELDERELHVVHVEDTPHHIRIMDEHHQVKKQRKFTGVAPVYRGHSYENLPENTIFVDEPRLAFKAVSSLLFN